MTHAEKAAIRATLRRQILQHLASDELTLAQLFSRMTGAGIVLKQRRLLVLVADMIDTHDIHVIRTIRTKREKVEYDERVIAAGPAKARLVPSQPFLAPLGVMPTRPLCPMSWIVVTSGCELEAA